MAADLTPVTNAVQALQARVADLEAERAGLTRDRDHWEHVYRLQLGVLAQRDAELTRVKGRLAVCRCGKLPA